jgi:hypothetical protein
MTEENMNLADLLQKSGDGDFLRSVAEAVLQILMETDVEGVIGAGRHERSADRLNYRNGYRDRALDTRLGTLQLKIPKLRQGSYFPPFLEPRRTSEKALVTVIQEAWIGGVSTRRVEELVQAMGLAGISKSQVSKLCKDIDERVNAFLDRPIEGSMPPTVPRTVGKTFRGNVFTASMAVSVARCHLPQGARGRPHRLGRRDNRRGGEHRRPARDRRPRPWTVGGGTILVELPQGLGQARPQGREARHLGCP